MSRIRFSRKQLTLPYALFLLFFVVFPLLLIVYYAFTDNNGKLLYPINQITSALKDIPRLAREYQEAQCYYSRKEPEQRCCSRK